jgi:hypothetical protein
MRGSGFVYVRPLNDLEPTNDSSLEPMPASINPQSPAVTQTSQSTLDSSELSTVANPTIVPVVKQDLSTVVSGHKLYRQRLPRITKLIVSYLPGYKPVWSR